MNFKLFGHFEVSGGTAIAKLRRRPRGQSILAYLILAQEPVSRQKIASELWPDSPPEQARTNLRRELHLLSSVLPELIETIRASSQTIAWPSTTNIRVDVEQFQNAYGEFTVADECEKKISIGQSITDLYTAPLLTSSHEYWVIPYRSAYTEKWQVVSKFLADQLMKRGDTDAAESIILKRLQEDSLNESAIYQLIDLRVRQNRRTDAIREFNAFETHFADELDARPSQQLLDRVRQIRAEAGMSKTDKVAKKDAATSVDYLVPGIIGQSSLHARFTARTDSLLWLDSVFSHSPQQRSGMIVIAGQAGIGKTRLIDQYLAHYQEQWRDVPSAQCANTDSQIPFSTVAAWISTNKIASNIEQLDEHFREELHRVFPEHFNTGSSRYKTPATSRESLRGFALLFQALGELIVKGSANRVLMVDDLQWCDQDSLAFIEYLFTAFSQSVRIVATLRTEDVAGSVHLAGFLERLESNQHIVTHELEPLDESDSLVLLSELAQQAHLSCGQEFLQAMCKRSEGNPLYLTEMIRHLESGGGIKDLIENDLIPGKVHAILKQRISGLSANAIEMARVAAFGEFTAHADLLRIASGLDSESVVDAFEELSARHVLREDRNGCYSFNHECMREAIQQHTSGARARFINNRIALAYETLYADLPHDIAGIIADHFERAGLVQDALRWYQRAMQNAESKLAYRECLSLYERATGHIDNFRFEDAEADLLFDVLLKRAHICALLYGFASQSVRKTCDEIERFLPRVRNPTRSLGMLNRLRMYWSFSGNLELATGYARQTVQKALQIDDSTQLIEAYRSLAFVEYQAGKLRRAHKSIRKGVAVGKAGQKEGQFDRNSMPWSYIMSRYMEAHMLAALGNFRGTRNALNDADGLEVSHITVNLMMFIKLGRAIAMYVSGDKAGARETANDLKNIAESCNLSRAMIFADAFGGWAESCPEKGVARIQTAIDQYRYLVEDHFLPFWMMLKAERLLDAGDHACALSTVRQGLAGAHGSSNLFLLPELLRFEGLALSACGEKLETTIASFDLSLEESRNQGTRLYMLRTLMAKNHYLEKVISDSSVSQDFVQNERSRTIDALDDVSEKIRKKGHCHDIDLARKVL